MVPPGVDGAEVIDVAFRRYDLALGAGLGEMAGKLFRIGHLGDLNELMLLGAIAGAEMAMRDVGMTGRTRQRRRGGTGILPVDSRASGRARRGITTGDPGKPGWQAAEAAARTAAIGA